MRGSTIMVSADPCGKYLTGNISGTPKPGTHVEMTTAALVGGRPTYQAVTRATGTKGPIFVLLEDDIQGLLYSTAYVSGTRCQVYAPEAGDDMNLLVADVAGTADDVAIGALMVVETTTGKLKANSSNNAIPWQAREAVTDPTADYWLWCTFLGQQA